MEFYRLKPNEVVSKLESNVNTGLPSQEVKTRVQKYGKNELEEKKKKTLLAMFFEQFKDFLVIILIAAALISIITSFFNEGDGLVDGIIILSIVILNAVLGVSQENKASNALAALKKMSSPHAKVLRDGHLVEVPSTDLTIGDIVVLETGDYVAADMRLLSSLNLKIDEAALTGESEPVEKHANITYEEDKLLADRANLAYMSTLVTYGRATGIVTGIGMDTEIGKIAKMLELVEEGKTPLQKTIDAFAKVLGIICIAVSVLVFVLGVFQGKDIIELFLTAIALAVAAIPEGLTAVITVVLALGMQRMVKRNAVIKNLSTVETLGQATVICSDKTGTLTKNKMTVEKVFDIDYEYEVTGSGYQTNGKILLNNKEVDNPNNLDLILKISLLCNDANLESDEKVLGDPTEGALLVLSAKGGYDLITRNEKFERVNEYPFDSTRKLMTTINKVEDKYLVLTKGATDQLIKRCKYISINGELKEITQEDIKMILNKNEEYSSQAYRVLGFAYQETNDYQSNDLENNLVFVGMVAMIDPPRDEAREAVSLCNKAGIRVMMITGDHLTTAKAIATKLGILKPGHIALSGEDTKNMSEKEYEDAILNCDVFARSTPEDKIRIVEILQKRGNVVAMTGDGVNDAPALKQADIGVAMGITGTEVSKETANMILTDDNFASIVSAVEEGRVIYSNIRKFTIFLISCNIGEIFIILLAMLFGGLFNNLVPLAAIHLLWINLITDSFPAFALGMEKKEPNIMNEKPRDPSEPLLNRPTLMRILIQGLGLALAALVSFYIGLQSGDNDLARTMIFVTVVIGELLRTYSARSEHKFIFQMNPFTNKYLNISVLVSLVLLMLLVYIKPISNIFEIEALSIQNLFIAIGLGIVPLLFGELTKIVKHKI